MPSLKFLIALPMPLPSPGNRFAPKMTMTIARMTSSSGRPIRPMVKLLLGGIVLPYARVFVSIFLISLYSLEIRSEPRQFTSGVDLVEVYATVSDARGEPVPGLTKDDCIVDEYGRRVSAGPGRRHRSQFQHGPRRLPRSDEGGARVSERASTRGSGDARRN